MTATPHFTKVSGSTSW